MAKNGMHRNVYHQGDPTFNAVVGILRREERMRHKEPQGLPPLKTKPLGVTPNLEPDEIVRKEPKKMTFVYVTRRIVAFDVERTEMYETINGYGIVGTTKDNKKLVLWPDDGRRVTQKAAIAAHAKIVRYIAQKAKESDGAYIVIDVPFVIDGEVWDPNGKKEQA